MKKFICVLMAVMMMLSSVAVLGVSAADGYAAKNPITDRFDSISEFESENADKEIYGYTYDFLYNDLGKTVGDFSDLDISFTKDGFPYRSSGESLESAYMNLSYYTKMIMINFFGGEKLYTEEYAVYLTNFFGNLVYPNFEEVTDVFDENVIPNKDDFYKAVVEKSKIWEVVEANWIDKNVDYTGFVNAMGGNSDSLTVSDSRKPKAVSKMFIEGIVSSIVAFGPVEYMFKILSALSANYSAYYEAASSLFRMKINAGKPVRDASGNVTARVQYGVDELKAVEGFLTYAFDGVFNYDFFRFPAARIANATDDAEKILCLMAYFAINYRYRNNASVIDGLASKIITFMEKNGRRSQAGYNDSEFDALKTNIRGLIDAVFKGDITVETAVFVGDLSKENIDTLPDDIFTQFKNWLSSLLRKIADYFDYIFKLISGEKKYGDDVLEW